MSICSHKSAFFHGKKQSFFFLLFSLNFAEKKYFGIFQNSLERVLYRRGCPCEALSADIEGIKVYLVLMQTQMELIPFNLQVKNLLRNILNARSLTKKKDMRIWKKK